MDELQMLRAALTEADPSRDVVDRSRQRLWKTMRGPLRRRRTGWLAAGLGLTAAAATAAVVIASAVTAPRATPNSPPAEAHLSGRQVLLAAAATAESKPATSGTYWHTGRVSVSPDGKIRLTSGLWTRRDGQAWISLEPGKISKLPKRQPIQLRGTGLGLDEIQQLPTDPDRLLATLRKHVKLGPDQLPEAHTVILLDELINGVPAPPKVRAAAFRALASLPHIKNLGKVKGGGYALEFTIEDAGTRMVVDPKTTKASAEGFTSFGGGRQSMGLSNSTAEWTNQLPNYQVVPLGQQKNYGIECHDEGNTPVCTKVLD